MSLMFILVAMMLFMYLVVIRPQRERQRRHQAMLDNVAVGDEVLTVGGLYGDVAEVGGERIVLLIADEVEIEVARKSIAEVVALGRDRESEAEAEAVEEPVGEADPAEVAEARP